MIALPLNGWACLIGRDGRCHFFNSGSPACGVRIQHPERFLGLAVGLPPESLRCLRCVAMGRAE